MREGGRKGAGNEGRKGREEEDFRVKKGDFEVILGHH